MRHDGSVLQAFPRHSLSEAALATSGAPIFLLDSFTQVQALRRTRTKCPPFRCQCVSERGADEGPCGRENGNCVTLHQVHARL